MKFSLVSSKFLELYTVYVLFYGFNLSNSLKCSIWFFELFRFSSYFLSNIILQCVIIILYWGLLWCQYWIRLNKTANFKNPGVSQKHHLGNVHKWCPTIFNNFWLSWSIKDLWGTKVMYFYVLKLLFLTPQSYNLNLAATSIY